MKQKLELSAWAWSHLSVSTCNRSAFHRANTSAWGLSTIFRRPMISRIGYSR